MLDSIPGGARPDVTRWDRVTQHLLDRTRIDPKVADRLPLAQPIYHHRVAHPRIQFHSLYPPPFTAIRKGLSLTEFYSGATTHSGRFSEGLLLRRFQIAVIGKRMNQTDLKMTGIASSVRCGSSEGDEYMGRGRRRDYFSIFCMFGSQSNIWRPGTEWR